MNKISTVTSLLAALALASQANADQNQLITNARLGVYSEFTGLGGVTRYNKIGPPIQVSCWTHSSGSPEYITCTTTNTEGLQVGKLIAVTTGDKSLRNAPHLVYSVATNSTFSFYLENNTQGENPGAIT